VSKRAQRRAAQRQTHKEQAPRTDLWIAAGLTLLAWVHRLIFLRSNRDFSWPYTIFYEGDAETFYSYARALLEGKLYDEGVPFHPPAPNDSGPPTITSPPPSSVTYRTSTCCAGAPSASAGTSSRITRRACGDCGRLSVAN